MRGYYLGTDIVELERIKKIHEKHGENFINKVYTPEERAHISSLRSPTSFLSGRWAAKEAIYKLLATELNAGVAWQEIDIGKSESGAPVVTLKGKAKEIAERKNIGPITLSISHCRNYAVAYAMAEGEKVDVC